MYDLPVKNLTSPFASATLISCNNSFVGIYFRYVLAISLVRMRRNSVNSASGLKTALAIVSATTISYKRTNILAI